MDAGVGAVLAAADCNLSRTPEPCRSGMHAFTISHRGVATFG